MTSLLKHNVVGIMMTCSLPFPSVAPTSLKPRDWQVSRTAGRGGIEKALRRHREDVSNERVPRFCSKAQGMSLPRSAGSTRNTLEKDSKKTCQSSVLTMLFPANPVVEGRERIICVVLLT